MTESFANLVYPIVRHVVDFQEGLDRGEDPDLPGTRRRIMELLGESEARSRASTQLASDFALAKAALVYWVDEILLGSKWARAAEWKEHILEYEIYGRWVGGEAFYERAAEAERLSGTDPLEVFYLCVVLGFQGRYAYEKDALAQWVARAYERIASSNPHPDRFLADDPAPREGLRPLPGQTMLLAVSVLVSATVLLTLAGFIAAVHWSL